MYVPCLALQRYNNGGPLDDFNFTTADFFH